MTYTKARAFVSELDEKNWFTINERGKAVFNPPRFAKEIMKNFNFMTPRDSEIIHVYTDGVYKSYGEKVIKEVANIYLNDDYRSHRVSETISYIESGTYTNPDELDKEIINVRNGLLDLETGELLPHDPKYFTTIQFPVFYNKEADCPNIKKFLLEVVGKNDIQVIKELFGYFLWRDYHIQKAFMFVGDGRNGKSTLISIMYNFLERNNISSVSLQDLNNSRFSTSLLVEKVANIFADLPSDALNRTGMFKMLTGGDYVKAERKFKDAFNFLNTAKLVFSCNKIPETKDDTSAFFRRWIFVNFPNKFEGEKCDPNILKKLTTEEEMSGLLNWAIEGLKSLLENKAFSDNKSTEDIMDTYQRLSSPVMAFAKDCVEQDSEGFIQKDDLYSAFVSYCKENNLPTMVKSVFSSKFISFIPYIATERRMINNERKMCWKGIKLLVNSNKINDKKVSRVSRVSRHFLILNSKNDNEKCVKYHDSEISSLPCHPCHKNNVPQEIKVSQPQYMDKKPEQPQDTGNSVFSDILDRDIEFYGSPKLLEDSKKSKKSKKMVEEVGQIENFRKWILENTSGNSAIQIQELKQKFLEAFPYGTENAFNGIVELLLQKGFIYESSPGFVTKV